MVSQSKYDPNAPSRAGRLDLVGHALALDFANTSSGRGGPQKLEHLRSPGNVVEWAAHTGVLSQEAADEARRMIAADDPALCDLLPRALALREAIHASASSLAANEAPARENLDTIKKACAEAIAAAELAQDGERFAWTWRSDPPGLWTILGPVAMSAIGLLRDSDPTRIKRCGGEHCGWVFFDLSKNNSRRWCEMSVCGNRAKARRFSAKKV